MVLELKEFRNSCKSILDAVDTSGTSIASEALELSAKNGILTMSVTNGEYFVRVLTKAVSSEEFHATVNAKLFLSLVAKITTDTVELSSNANFLMVKGNGTYKIPLTTDEMGVLSLEKIDIENTLQEFDIDCKIPQSIYEYNSKELLKSGVRSNIQKMFYIDQDGCITFTSGACINPFSLPAPIRILLPEKIVKLFRLLKSESVRFQYGVSAMPNGQAQPRVRFSNNDVEITTKLLNDPSMLDRFPAKSLRGLATMDYPCSAEINKDLVIDSIGRLSLFTDRAQPVSYTYLKFGKDTLTAYDSNHDNHETVPLVNPISTLEGEYECILNTEDLRITLENSKSTNISIGFGNHRAILLSKDGISNIMPECVEK